ncbi:MAG: hypothetical protein SGPRY_001788 [Prymnesium sp.]
MASPDCEAGESSYHDSKENLLAGAGPSMFQLVTASEPIQPHDKCNEARPFKAPSTQPLPGATDVQPGN